MKELFEDIAKQQGWNENSQVGVLLEFLDEQKSIDLATKFEKFLDRKKQEEDEM